MKEFKLTEHEFIELDNLLKIMQLCESGGMAKKVISEGLVKVDGNIELRKRCKIRSGQIVEYEEQRILVK